MAALADVMEYILRQYPHKNELSNARLTKLIYLADWVSAIRRGKQVTAIEWYFDNYGPFVWKILDTAKDNSRFSVEYSNNYFGSPKAVIRCDDAPAHTENELSDEERECVDFAIEQTKDLGWDSFIRLVYSTHPVITSERYNKLDLVGKAKEYAQ